MSSRSFHLTSHRNSCSDNGDSAIFTSYFALYYIRLSGRHPGGSLDATSEEADRSIRTTSHSEVKSIQKRAAGSIPLGGACQFNTDCQSYLMTCSSGRCACSANSVQYNSVCLQSVSEARFCLTFPSQRSFPVNRAAHGMCNATPCGRRLNALAVCALARRNIIRRQRSKEACAFMIKSTVNVFVVYFALFTSHFCPGQPNCPLPDIIDANSGNSLASGLVVTSNPVTCTVASKGRTCAGVHSQFCFHFQQFAQNSYLAHLVVMMANQSI